jgi:hypothetical protein
MTRQDDRRPLTTFEKVTITLALATGAAALAVASLAVFLGMAYSLLPGSGR